MAQPRLVIFDCDGVLVDSEAIASRVDAELLTRAGFPIDAEELAERYAGLTFRDILLEIEKISEAPLSAQLLVEEEKLVDLQLAEAVEATEGVAAAIAKTMYPRAICSNSKRGRIVASLERAGLRKLFHEKAIFPADETPSKRPKPAPDVYLHAAAAMKVKPQQTFVVEDSRHGVTAARAAGMRVIGFTGASHAWPGLADQLTEAGAETVIRRWSDFPTVLEALSTWSDEA